MRRVPHLQASMVAQSYLANLGCLQAHTLHRAPLPHAGAAPTRLKHGRRRHSKRTQNTPACLPPLHVQPRQNCRIPPSLTTAACACLGAAEPDGATPLAMPCRTSLDLRNTRMHCCVCAHASRRPQHATVPRHGPQCAGQCAPSVPMNVAPSMRQLLEPAHPMLACAAACSPVCAAWFGGAGGRRVSANQSSIAVTRPLHTVPHVHQDNSFQEQDETASRSASQHQPDSQAASACSACSVSVSRARIAGRAAAPGR